jgi:hypothetical protein
MIYIYGAGKKLDHYKNKILWKKVKGILDISHQKNGKEYMGVKILHPSAVKYLLDDIIVITSQKFYWDIREQMISEYDVKPEQITGICSWLGKKEIAVDYHNEISDYYAINDVFYIAATLGIDDLLTYTDIFSHYGIISLNDIRLKRWFANGRIVDCKKECVYNLPYGKCGISVNEKIYDAILCMDIWERLSKDEKYALLNSKNSRYLLITLSYQPYSKVVKYIKQFTQYGEISIISGYSAGWIIVINYEVKKNIKDYFRMYMITHKKIVVPLYMRDRNISIIFAGAVTRVSYGYLRDDIGENISILNPLINECTALYWIWKNSCAYYIGMCHYRRVFLCKENVDVCLENVLWPNEALKYLQKYDIIVANISDDYEKNGVLNTMSTKVESKIVEEGMNVVRNLLKLRQPEYIDAFEFVMHGVAMFPCNMFITRREILNSYCEWLFSFIIDAAKSIDVSECDDYSKRIIGFIAERMLTVWLLKQNLKIKELPIMVL